MTDPFEALSENRHRMSEAARVARSIKRPDIAAMADHYSVKLNALAGLTNKWDGAYITSELGKWTLGMDDVEASVAYAMAHPRLRDRPTLRLAL